MKHVKALVNYIKVTLILILKGKSSSWHQDDITKEMFSFFTSSNIVLLFTVFILFSQVYNGILTILL